MSEDKKELLAVSFEGKLPNEEVYHVFHKHWLSDLPEIGLLFGLMLLPLIGVGILSFIPQVFPYVSMLWVVAAIYFAFVPLYIFIHWVNDAFDILVLTDQRVVNIMQNGFMSRSITVAELNQIQLATYKQHGMIDQLFNIGTVEVKTASEGSNMHVSGMHRPDRVTDLILDFASRYQKASPNPLGHG